jgi:hypothetical protein
MSKLSFFYFTESSSLARLGAALFFLCQSHAFALGAPQTTTSPALVFVDLANHTAAVPAINSMVAQGIMRGVSQTQFAPDAYYSMGEFAVSMQHMFNLPPPAQPINFTDVARGSPIYDAVEAIVPFLGRGLLCPGSAAGSTFVPGQPVVRAWATIVTVNILTAQNTIQLARPAEAESALANVTDAGWLPPEARIIFATALNNEIIGRQPQNEIDLAFEPTRADMAVFLDAIQKKFNIPPVQPAP